VRHTSPSRKQLPGKSCCRRRLVKRIYIPMPDAAGRRSLLKHTLEGQPVRLNATDLERLVQVTEGYSGSDLAALCREAAMQPIRWGCFMAVTPSLHPCFPWLGVSTERF